MHRSLVTLELIARMLKPLPTRVLLATALAAIGITAVASDAFNPGVTNPHDYSYAGQGVAGAPENQFGLQPGATATLFVDLKNTGSRTWESDGPTPLRIGTDRPRYAASPFAAPGWIFPDRPGSFNQKVTQTATGKILAPATRIAPGETGRFSFTVKAPATPGSYKLYVQPVWETQYWLGRDLGIHWNITVGTVYDYRWLDQNYDTPRYAGERRTLTMTVKNTGSVAWTNTGDPNTIRLGTSRPNDRISRLYDTGWQSPTRVGSFVGRARIDGDGRLQRGSDGKVLHDPVSVINPGEIAHFSFPVTPSQSFASNEYFNLLIEGRLWLPDFGVFWPVAAGPAPSPTPSPSPQPSAVPSPSPVATPSPAPPTASPTPLIGRVTGFENGTYAGLDNNGPSQTANVQLTIPAERAYEGTRALKISYDGTVGNAFGRVWYGGEGTRSLGWQTGSDVWYGGAFFVPDPARLRYTDLIRWDNYGRYAVGDVGGVLASEGKLSVTRNDYGDNASYAKLTPEVAIPANRWFWVEVHQKFSSVNGQALTELYLDGVKVGSSTAANSMGRMIDTIRYGYVYNWDAGGASTLYLDRVSVSDRARGPLAGTAARNPAGESAETLLALVESTLQPF